MRKFNLQLFAEINGILKSVIYKRSKPAKRSPLKNPSKTFFKALL